MLWHMHSVCVIDTPICSTSSLFMCAVCARERLLLLHMTGTQYLTVLLIMRECLSRQIAIDNKHYPIS